MELHVSLGRARGLAAEVYRQLREAVLDGRLRPGEPLPATRELADRLEVSRNTILHAYQRLTAEGFLVGKVGAGTFVSAEGAALPPRRAPASSALRPRPGLLASAPPPVQPRAEVAYDLQLGVPDPSLFPWDAWRSLIAATLRGRGRSAASPGPEGDPRLRAAIARHLGISRSVRAGADDVLVTSGAQQAFDLIGRVLVEPGACVAVEDPGFPPAWRAWQAQGARVVPVRVDGEGIDVARLPDRARLVYVTPSHQFPLGIPMSLARRQALLAWADRRGAAIIEDDYDSELRYDGRPLEPLQSLDRRGRVLYVGTFSKVLLPTLRLGFVVAPASLQPALRAAKLHADGHGPPETQRALAAFIDEGQLARHVRRLLRVYRERRERLLESLGRYLGDELEVLPASAGLHVAAWCRDRRRDAGALAAAALAEGVLVESLGPYFRGRSRAGLAFGYGLIPREGIDEAVRRLAKAFVRQGSARPRRGRRASF